MGCPCESCKVHPGRTLHPVAAGGTHLARAEDFCPVVIHPAMTLASGATETLQFRIPEVVDPRMGWLVSLVAYDQGATTTALAGLLGYDGLRANSGPAHAVGSALVGEQPQRIFYPWPRMDLTLAANNDVATFLARGIMLPLAAVTSGLGRYLFGTEDATAITNAAEVGFAVPLGATAFRVGFLDPSSADVVVRTYANSGATQAAAWVQGAGVDSQNWVALTEQEIPGGQREVTLQLSAGGPHNMRIDWRYDLWARVGGA